MESWTKLYQRILQSSVWKLPSDKRIVWLTLLALKDENGCVFGSEGWLADQARVPDKECEGALRIFLSPDKRSRTPDNEGRKLEKIEGGWRILNHHLYRDGIEEQREKWRRQKANQRAKEAAQETKGKRLVKRGKPMKGEASYLAAQEAGASKEQLEEILRDSQIKGSR